MKIIILGALRSQSSHSVVVENSGQEYQIAVDQSVYYTEHCSQDSVTTLKLKTARNFINYESTEKILRFASTTKISKVSGKMLSFIFLFFLYD